MENQVQSITVRQDSEKSIFNVYFKSITKDLIFPLKTFAGITEPNENRRNLLLPALWDTGNTDTHITRTAALELGLITRQEYKQCNARSCNLNMKTVPITILLPDARVLLVGALISNDIPDVSLLMGMDVMCRGNFQIKVHNNRSVLSIARPIRKQESPVICKDRSAVLISNIDSKDFTRIQIAYSGIVDLLIFPVKVAAFDFDTFKTCTHNKTVNCVIDTGAQHSVITFKLAHELNLKIFAREKNSEFDTSVISCTFTDGYCTEIPVWITDKSYDDFDFMLGMDIIASGGLSIVNANNQTMVLLDLKQRPLEWLI